MRPTLTVLILTGAAIIVAGTGETPSDAVAKPAPLTTVNPGTTAADRPAQDYDPAPALLETAADSLVAVKTSPAQSPGIEGGNQNAHRANQNAPAAFEISQLQSTELQSLRNRIAEQDQIIADLREQVARLSEANFTAPVEPPAVNQWVRSKEKPQDVPGFVWIKGGDGTRVEGFWRLTPAVAATADPAVRYTQPTYYQSYSSCGPGGCGSSSGFGSGNGFRPIRRLFGRR